jgi:Leucine-rich repeat (LRR) protein
LTSLTHLLLQKCGLTGSIPSWIGELTNLEYLGLGNNDFTGFVPSEISDLVRLELLGLEENTLSGNIELFRPLSDLKSLYLEHNYISGTISDALMLAWPNLEELYISDCALTGRLPPLFFNHPNNLKVIDLHSNQMEGPLPHEINENGKLEYLGLHENTFTGVVPESLSNFKALRHLDISSNPLISTLPEKMGELTTLEYLFAGKTDFVPSEVPEFLIRLTNLRGLSVHQNHLTGTIPSWISVLSNLEVLDLRKEKKLVPLSALILSLNFVFVIIAGNNHLDGGIPGQIGYLSGLRQLFLKENNLSGSIPPSFLGLSNLEVLLLEQNNFADDGDVVICSSNLSVRLFVADCGVGNGIQCSCCSACCDVGDAVCNVWESNGDLDPILEYSEIKKDYYSFVRPTGK